MKCKLTPSERREKILAQIKEWKKHRDAHIAAAHKDKTSWEAKHPQIVKGYALRIRNEQKRLKLLER